MNPIKLIVSSIVLFCSCSNQIQSSLVGEGWSGNSVNTTIFRKNSLVSNKSYQYTAYYDQDGFVVIGQRTLNSQTWTIQKTAFKGNIKDAHNSISIMVDGDGFIHLSWDHHNNNLHYAISSKANDINSFEIATMCGKNENKVTYPEFYKLSNGNILFLYRDGGSGNGNLVLNQYDCASKKWSRIQDNLINGSGKRNAYPQFCVDSKDNLHISWVWRNTPDVATNHNMCYAYSSDLGKTWQKSTGEKYTLPISYEQSEVIFPINQNNDLMNQTSMTTDDAGNVYIASYWRDTTSHVPQYQIIYKKNDKWKLNTLRYRTENFSLSGSGTKKIPISRPQLLVQTKNGTTEAILLFRDEKLKSVASAAYIPDIEKQQYSIKSLSKGTLGDWEPSYDTEMWKTRKKISIFTQEVHQVDGEGLQASAPTAVKIIDIK